MSGRPGNPLERGRRLRKNQKMNDRWKFVNLSRERKCNGTLSSAASSLITPPPLLIELAALGFNNAVAVISRGLLGTEREREREWREEGGKKGGRGYPLKIVNRTYRRSGYVSRVSFRPGDRAFFAVMRLKICRTSPRPSPSLHHDHTPLTITRTWLRGVVRRHISQ